MKRVQIKVLQNQSLYRKALPLGAHAASRAGLLNRCFYRSVSSQQASTRGRVRSQGQRLLDQGIVLKDFYLHRLH